MVACQTSSKGSGPGNAANLSTETNGGQPVGKQGNMDICSTYGDLARLCRQGSFLDVNQVFYNMPTQDGVSWITMISGYAQQGMLTQDLASWTMKISGYVKQGYTEETFKLFYQMHADDLKTDKAALSAFSLCVRCEARQGHFHTALNECASLAVLDKGERVHACIVKAGLEKDVFVGNVLVGMYSKSGSLQDAPQAFDNISYV
ncbi:unnamed protein product [Sphagnum troendelagicum]|uniref:Pentatricopeptide repeat-containing protein n=1 Tax=Sphagnum troendelagicum TaxID=128251 RepID=A0ABP0UP88_9BRYO